MTAVVKGNSIPVRCAWASGDLSIRYHDEEWGVPVHHDTFDRYIWQFVDGRPVLNSPRSLKQVPSRTPGSDAMSKDLKKRGFNFVGSTICYAFMQAVGMVNDHVVDCFRYGALT